MKITIRSRNLHLDESTRAHVERRLRFALGRFASRIRGVRVVLLDANGPRGGVDKQCTIECTIDRIGSLLAGAEDSDLLTAVDAASHRMDRLVARELSRYRISSEEKTSGREIRRAADETYA